MCFGCWPAVPGKSLAAINSSVNCVDSNTTDLIARLISVFRACEKNYRITPTNPIALRPFGHADIYFHRKPGTDFEAPDLITHSSSCIRCYRFGLGDRSVVRPTSRAG